MRAGRGAAPRVRQEARAAEGGRGVRAARARRLTFDEMRRG